MENHNTTANGQGDSALQIVDHPHAANRFAIVDLYGDFLKNQHGAVCGFKTREDAAKHLNTGEAPSVPRVGIEEVAHMMASFLGQLVDEGILDAIDEQITMGGLTPKVIANRLLDRFESVS